MKSYPDSSRFGRVPNDATAMKTETLYTASTPEFIGGRASSLSGSGTAPGETSSEARRRGACNQERSASDNLLHRLEHSVSVPSAEHPSRWSISRRVSMALAFQ
jgi:hypothetical protein